MTRALDYEKGIMYQALANNANENNTAFVIANNLTNRELGSYAYVLRSVSEFLLMCRIEYHGTTCGELMTHHNVNTLN